MYTVDHGFMTKLKELDPKLGAFFNREAKFVVITYQNGRGRDVPIMQVKNPDGSFRVPDQRDIDKLLQSDNQRISVFDRIAADEELMRRRQEIKRAKVREEIRERTLDDKYQLRRAAQLREGASRKVGKHTRRIAPKPRGQVY